MFKKIFVFAILIALLVASFPTVAMAETPRAKKMEAKWDQYVDNVKAYQTTHAKIDKQVQEWLKDNKSVGANKTTKIQYNLNKFHQNFDAAKAIVAEHPGFDAKGKIIDIGAADKSIKHLGEHLALVRISAHELSQLDTHLNR